MDDATATKVCTKCGLEKRLDEFHASKTGRLGRRADCQVCANARNLAKWVEQRDVGREARRIERAKASAGAVKNCRACGVEKPLLEFYKYPRSTDGRMARCRTCFMEKRRAERLESTEEKSRRVAALATKPTKFCGRCETEKPRSSFNARRRCRDGLSPWCKACNAEYQKEHYEANKAHRLKLSREWYAANRERKNATSRAWYAAHPERATENAAAWADANPNYQREYIAQRRARMRAVTIEPIVYEDLPSDVCNICDERLDHSLRYPDPMSLSIDHIIPIAKGGWHSQDNLAWTHLLCNMRKSDREDYVAR